MKYLGKITDNKDLVTKEYVDGIKIDGVTGKTITRFGTCSTAAATVAKTVDISAGTFSLEAGVILAVKFSNANTASSPTLNVNGTGAKNIFVNGAQITTNAGAKGLLKGVVIFIYDGTQYHLIGNYYDSNSNTWRNVQVNGTQILGTGTSTGALNIADGTNTTVTNSSGTVSVNAPASMTAEEATTGTETGVRVISPKVLADYVKEEIDSAIIAAIAEAY